MENVAYVPLDIPQINVPEEMLWKEFYELQHNNYHWDYWKSLVVKGYVKDWSDSYSNEVGFRARFDSSKTPLWNPNLSPTLLEYFQKVLSALPFSDCKFAEVHGQQAMVPPHQDIESALNCYDVDADENAEPEPAGLKVMLTHKNRKSFFVLDNKPKSIRKYISFPEETNSFAINERKFLHGAKYLGEAKLILTTFGFINKEKHKEMIERSIKKFNDYVIRFEDV